MLQPPLRLGAHPGALALALLLTAAAPASAHDFWLEPTTFAPAAAQVVGIRARVGQGLIGDAVPRDPALIEAFVVEDDRGRRPVVGRDGADPAGLVRLDTPGFTVVGYISTPSRVELSAATFNAYLRDEGLDAVAALRARSGATDLPARELFSRCAKTFLLSGTADRRQHDRVLGCPVELVAERNPYALGTDGLLPVRLTDRGRPLPGALVVAFNRRNPGEVQRVRTDGDGRAVVHVGGGGLWLVKAVHMVAAPTGSGADWASYWASLTFNLDAVHEVTP